MTITLHVTVPDEGWVERLTDLDDRVDLRVWDFSPPQPSHSVDLAVLPYTVSSAGLRQLDPERIAVIQSQALGYDGVREALPSGVTYCNAVGVHEESTAGLAVALLLASQRQLDVYARERGQWNRRWGTSVADRRVMLLGYGGIGIEMEKRLEGFGAEMVRVAGHRREDERGLIHGTDELPDLLPTVDVVMVAVPLSEATTGLIDDAFLAALPDDAVIVNVSRGRVADTDAIVRQAGRVRYATDVTDPEPLPAVHPLWAVPGVLITPHVGGMSSAMQPRVDRVVRGQIERLLDGRDPHSIVISP
ncbi:NAD(P)-dependent oxidoreductase [Aeromicrobium sp.]|uniref:NAD(P)-dependent oxidoreductase n=1 Tax=Aeromicrobium sp. TaxID=1871063 RepID=UPI0019AD5CB4|nr:NAD(P)-dependent oxidoreductase [Aeromicrobium sp.]MBC7631156.1 hydroxyacid dehydrogenase [Aeromicrobium sp.]